MATAPEVAHISKDSTTALIIPQLIDGLSPPDGPSPLPSQLNLEDLFDVVVPGYMVARLPKSTLSSLLDLR